MTEQRIRFNELVSVLRQIDPSRLDEAHSQFPEFSNEIKFGPDAGDSELEYEIAIQRARFTDALCSEVIFSGQNKSEEFLLQASSLPKVKIVAAIAGGTSGAALLGALGLANEQVTRVAAIITAFAAVANSLLDIYSKRYSGGELQKTVELRTAIGRLRLLQNDLRLAIRHRASIDDLAETSERCNEQALAIGKGVDLLRAA